MGKWIDYTVAYENADQTVDLCRIVFGGDGSYYVTAPYHPQDKAVVAKVAVNYMRVDQTISFADAKELAVLDDDEQRLKISHHASGLLQFSGVGIKSGVDEAGNPKGIGTMSFPLAKPTLGPSFSLIFSDPLRCGRATKNRVRTVALPERDIEHLRPPGISGLMIVGYYFPVRWREFVYRGPDGNWWINLLHPGAQALKPLRIVLGSLDSRLPGAIGLEVRPHGLEDVAGEPSFVLSTCSGDLREVDGEVIGDQLICLFPRRGVTDSRVMSLNYELPSLHDLPSAGSANAPAE